MAQQGQGEATSLPPGFRFHPTDEELILHYLRNRAADAPCPVPIIANVDIYKFDPWDLPKPGVANTVPLLADYDHMADHDDLFGGSDFDDATCRPMIKSQQQQHQHQQPHDGRF
ncbi:hypothetical protein ZWY2020_010057 [Hordeum vulgare]|nr:hypothetical protein ZWY2020_010057 [Hordeum vulgare]